MANLLSLAVICVVVFCCVSSTVEGNAYKSESQLFESLFINRSRNAHIRPVIDTSDVLTIQVGIAVLNLIQVDESVGAVSLQIWQRMAWKDISLTWDPAQYGGTKSLQVPVEKIWTPDMVLYNSATQNAINQPGGSALAVVHHDGEVMWIPPLIVNVICHMDLTFFPRDKHKCQLKFGSWSYDGSKVNLALLGNQTSVDMGFYTEHGSWGLEGGPAQVQEKKYPCCPDPFYDVTFDLSLFRRHDFLQHSLSAPVIMLGLLVPFVFLVPARNSHKTILGVGLLISLSVFMSSLGNVIPATASNTPLICKYYVSTFVLLSISICFSSLILCASGGMLARTRRPPRFLKKLLVDRLGKLCCVPTGASLGVPEADHLVLATVEPNANADQSVAVEKGHETRRHPSSSIVEWIIVAHVADRILFVLFEIVNVVLVVSFLMQS